MSQRLVIIMAGGSGERFWPVSRRHHPKQLLKLSGDVSMLEQSAERAEPLVGNDHILIATSAQLGGAIRQALPRIPARNVLGEPAKRNTAGCLAFATAHALRFGPAEDVAMCILTADHAIAPTDVFQKTLAEAFTFAEEEDALITFGIPPTRPETGFGYVEVAEKVRETTAGDIHRVRRFREKPDIATANEFLEAGNFLWNSGMFCWKLSTFRRELAKHLPRHDTAIAEMAAALKKGDDAAVSKIFGELDSVSIDNGLMEKSDRVFTSRAKFTWDDVGEWSALERTSEPDDERNIIQGDGCLLDSEGCVIYNDAKSHPMTITGSGLKDIIVAVTDDAVLVVPKEKAQDVKKIVERLRDSGRDDLL